MSERLKTFQEILAAAVADMAEHGFDSQERVDRWTRDLRDAAVRSMISPESLDQQLRQALAAHYRRMVDRGGVAKFHRGVERFTLERVRPALRAELDRRIAASANLIKLNRAEAIEKTLRRFQGWSTSIPPGGVSGESKAEVKASVRKSLASLPWEERRVLIDQGHKLIGAINQIVATDGGAIAVKWRSNWRQPNYAAREDHKERDGLIYLIRDSWAHQAGLVRKGTKHTGPDEDASAGAYYDEVDGFAQLPFCRCYGALWVYALRDLPEDMLTAKGKEALSAARGGEEVRAARTGRADSGSPVSPHQMMGQKATSVPVPVDRDHAVPTLAAVADDATRIYVDKNIPRVAEIGGVVIDPAIVFWDRESASWLHLNRLTSSFLSSYGREPTAEESAEIRIRAKAIGDKAEAESLAKRKIDAEAWANWKHDAIERIVTRRRRERISVDIGHATG